MSIKPTLQKAGVFCLWLLIASCVNLKKVNDYASASGKNIKKFEELGYSFVQACNDKCLIEQLDKKEFLKKSCNCKNENEADSIMFLMYKSAKGYFDGLAKLSNNEVTSYKYDALTKALKDGDFGQVKINKDQVDAYSKISEVLTRAITDRYRRKKISQYIGEANDAVKVLLNALEFNLARNLTGRLESKNQSLQSYYFDLFDDTKASAYEKKKILEDYNSATSEINSKKRQIITFGNGLNTIAQGHQKLFENRNKLGTKELKELLSQYASDIQDIIDKINKLKNQD